MANSAKSKLALDERLQLSCEVRLLLLFSRVKLSSDQEQRAITLGESISDWELFSRKAAQHFLAPLCLYHVSRLGTANFVGEATHQLKRVAKRMALRSLQLAVAQRKFITSQLLPEEVPFVVIKGRALGSCYYPEAGLRYARDLDILVSSKHVPELIFRAINSGYRLYPESRIVTRDEIQLLSRQTMVVTLLDANNVPIEVHSHLDKAGFIFDHEAMLRRRRQIQIDGVGAGALRTEDHFIYICVHHTRHFWSRLNWLADLDALIASPDFSLQKVMEEATGRGLTDTVNACLTLHAACGSNDPFGYAKGNPQLLDLLMSMTSILSAGTEKEFDMRPHQASLDFSFEWQFPRGYKARRALNFLKKKWRPSLLDYEILALPRRWQWLYVPMKPITYLIRGIRGVG